MSASDVHHRVDFFGSPMAHRGLTRRPQRELTDEEKADRQRSNASTGEESATVREGRGNDRAEERTRAIVETWRREARDLKAEPAWTTELTLPPQMTSERQASA
jgi:hypothetical protein